MDFKMEKAIELDDFRFMASLDSTRCFYTSIILVEILLTKIV